jgi:mannose-6-phosphate isomerase-like protein (cupin superfamily)
VTKARELSQEEMESTRLARFEELPLWGLLEDDGIPVEARDVFVARRLWSIVCPSSLEGSLQNPAPIRDTEDFVMTIAACPPGQGPGLHHHLHATETYTCLQGRFRVAWGARGEHELVLSRWDTLSVPPGVIRRFQNVGDEEGFIQVILSGDMSKMKNDSASTPEQRDEIAAFGEDVLARVEATGRRFDAGVA